MAENGGILAIGLLELSEMLLVVLEVKRLAQEPTGAAGEGETSTLGVTTAAGLLGSGSIWDLGGSGSATGAGFTGSD